MSEPGLVSDNFDGQQDDQRSAIQPYQFEPRVNSNEGDRNTESPLSSDESMGSEDENANPRLENSDWYVTMIVIEQFVVLFSPITDLLMVTNKIYLMWHSCLLLFRNRWPVADSTCCLFISSVVHVVSTLAQFNFEFIYT